MKTNPELESALLKSPDNSDAWQVYADWLQEQGDLHGDAIALELRESAAATQVLVAANPEHFMGPLAAHQKTYDGENDDAFTWKRGFIHALRLSHDTYADSGFEGALVDVLDGVLSHASGRFLREIAFVFNDDPNEDNLQPLIDCLIKHSPASIQKLHFGDYQYAGPSDPTATGMTEISWYSIGDLSKLWPAVPNLRTLITQCGSSQSTIAGVGMVLGEIVLPELTHAEFRTGGLEAVNARAIATASFPNIERLDIWYGDESYGGETNPDVVAPLLSRTDLPKLKRLGLMNALFTNDLIDMLVGAPLIKQLDVLDLSMGCLTDEGAARIVSAADAFRHIKSLDVGENHLSEAGLSGLRDALTDVEIASNEQREEEEGYRFTSVAE